LEKLTHNFPRSFNKEHLRVSRICEFQKKAVEDKEWRKELEGYGGDEVLKLFERWEKLTFQLALFSS
jgi:hypothetical protein